MYKGMIPAFMLCMTANSVFAQPVFNQQAVLPGMTLQDVASRKVDSDKAFEDALARINDATKDIVATDESTPTQNTRQTGRDYITTNRQEESKPSVTSSLTTASSTSSSGDVSVTKPETPKVSAPEQQVVVAPPPKSVQGTPVTANKTGDAPGAASEQPQQQYKVFPVGTRMTLDATKLVVGKQNYFLFHNGSPVYLDGIETFSENASVSNFLQTVRIGDKAKRFFAQISPSSLNCYVSSINIISAVTCSVNDSSIAQEMIREGYGYANSDVYKADEMMAMNAKKGIWYYQ